MAQIRIERVKITVMDNKNCKTCLYCKNYKKLRFAGLGQKMIYECHIEPPKTVLTMFNKPKAYWPEVDPDNGYCSLHKPKINDVL